MKSKLLTTLAEIIGLLTSCGEMTRAEWFRQKLLVLEREASSSAGFQVVIGELRRILVGMGSLSDLSLTPVASSGLTRQEIRNLQWQLVEDLDGAIRALQEEPGARA